MNKTLLLAGVASALVTAACTTTTTVETGDSGGSDLAVTEAAVEDESTAQTPDEEVVAADRGEGPAGADGVDPAVTIPPAVSELGGDPVRGGGNPQGGVVELLSFRAPTVAGGEIDGSTYLGRDVVLWFWAPWCSWCNVEAPRVSAAATEFAGQVEILGVGGVSDLDNMERFVDRHELHHLTHVADLDGAVWLSFDVTYQPWWIFINDDGTVVENWQGRLSDEEIRERIDTLIEL